MPVQRVAVFGGTFDPVHNGHLHIAQIARKSLDLDLIVFVPCRQSPHKTSATEASEEDRCEMLACALADYPWATVSRIEIEQAPPSFSWCTAEAMREIFPEAQLFWLMGSDQWKVIDQWSRPEHLAELVEIIVFQRGKQPSVHPRFSAHFIQGAHPAAASEIRATAREGLRSDWLPPKVEQFILSNGLYGCGT
jgi:nicotinate-nucleotide adenylyltransferase